MKTTKVDTIADKSVSDTLVKKNKPTKIINNDRSKMFDKSGKMISVVSPEIVDALKNGHGAIKMTDTKTAAKKVAPKKESKPWKYNTPMKELVALLEKYKADKNPLADELSTIIDKKRAQWKKFYEQNKEKYKVWSSEWRQRNPNKVKEAQKRHAEKVKSQKSATPKPKATSKPKTAKKSKKSSSKKSK